MTAMEDDWCEHLIEVAELSQEKHLPRRNHSFLFSAAFHMEIIISQPHLFSKFFKINFMPRYLSAKNWVR